MSPFLTPVLAQMVSLHMADYTEARYLKSEVDFYEASTAPAVGLQFDWKRAHAALGYSPTLTVTPLEEEPRSTLVYHQLGARVGYTWQHSGLSLTSSFGFGGVNFRVAALRGQPPPTGGEQPPTQPDGTPGVEPPPGPTEPTPGDPNNGQITFSSEDVQYYSSATTLAATHSFTKELSGEAHVSQMRGGGLDDRSSELYPALHSWSAGVNGTYDWVVSARDAFASTVALDGAISSFGATSLTLNAQEAWNHNFDGHTFTGLSAGINITRFSQENGLQGFSIYPTFHAWLRHQLRLWGGMLAFGVYSYSGPTLDPLRALVDPRFGVGGNITYTRKRFSVGIDGGAAISLHPPDHSDGAIDSAQAQATASYQLSDAVSVQGGGRYWRQRVEDVLVIPRSWSAFVGISLGYDTPLLGGHRGAK